jgi:hypothetical protein
MVIKVVGVSIRDRVPEIDFLNHSGLCSGSAFLNMAGVYASYRQFSDMALGLDVITVT